MRLIARPGALMLAPELSEAVPLYSSKYKEYNIVID
jgi:hypothetical protein